MKSISTLALAFAMAAAGIAAHAADDAGHSAHHPAGAVSTQAARAIPGQTPPAAMDRADAQMTAMREMHDRMMAAGTPGERTTLMADQMKTMQDGMEMMKGMGPRGMAGMQGNAAARSQMTEQRMEMMESMMQLMMDRLAAAPSK
jgi:hypothetical protein